MSARERREPPRLAARPHLVLPVPRDPEGLTGPTPAETRGPNWRRSSRGRYVGVEVELTPQQRILEAAALLPAYGGVTGWAGINWAGGERWFEGFEPDGRTFRPVVLAVGGDNIRSQPGILDSAERLEPRDLTTVDDVRITTPVRSACFEMRYAFDVRQAAVALSMAAYHDLVSVEEMAEYAWQHNGWTGIPKCRGAVPLAEENCWSPPEVEMVLTWRIDAELPRPLCNHPLFDRAGNHVGTPDMVDVEAGVVGQYEGSLHLLGAQRDVDVYAEERYRRLGLECFTMRNTDRLHPGRMAERMHAARERARWQAERDRAWTVEYPSWWIPTDTVERRRQLTEPQRRRLLRYRTA
jgi:hypothetical protein